MTPTGRVETDAIGTLWTEAKAKEERMVRYDMVCLIAEATTAAGGEQIQVTFFSRLGRALKLSWGLPRLCFGVTRKPLVANLREEI